jgi:hypothetical protein
MNATQADVLEDDGIQQLPEQSESSKKRPYSYHLVKQAFSEIGYDLANLRAGLLLTSLQATCGKSIVFGIKHLVELRGFQRKYRAFPVYSSNERRVTLERILRKLSYFGIGPRISKRRSRRLSPSELRTRTFWNFCGDQCQRGSKVRLTSEKLRMPLKAARALGVSPTRFLEPTYKEAGWKWRRGAARLVNIEDNPLATLKKLRQCLNEVGIRKPSGTVVYPGWRPGTRVLSSRQVNVASAAFFLEDKAFVVFDKTLAVVPIFRARTDTPGCEYGIILRILKMRDKTE